MRTSSDELQASAVQALVEACRAIGVEANENPDATIVTVRHAGGAGSVDLAVLGRAVVSGEVGVSSSRPLVVVADMVTASARESLDSQGVGWLDRRGHLRLVSEDGVLVDAAVGSIPRRAVGDGATGDAFGRGRATIEVALALLLSPDDPPGIRELAREVGLSPSTVSQAHARLERASLIAPEGPPLLPELFWELADRWRPRWVDLAAEPSAAMLDDDQGGWVLAGDVVAAAQGAPVVVGGAAPRAFYVETDAALRRARQELGDAAGGARACRVAVAPSRLVHTRATETTGEGAGRQVPVLVSALDLAGDPSRGREILTAWTQLPDGRPAVWQG